VTTEDWGVLRLDIQVKVLLFEWHIDRHPSLLTRLYFPARQHPHHPRRPLRARLPVAQGAW
jgi:hypothetical protein